jgi:type II secretory pathway component PulC
MEGSLTKFIPLIFITLFCLGSVESGYLAVEHYILRLPERAETAVAMQKKQQVKKGETQKPRQDLQIILKRQLFGAPPSEEKVVAPPVEAEKVLEPSTLDVILMGTIRTDKEGNRAIIMGKNDRKQQIYEVGDSIEGALIEKILRGKVILVSEGKSEILDMSKAAEVRSNYKSAPAPRPVARSAVRQQPVRRINTRARTTPIRTRVVSRPARATTTK